MNNNDEIINLAFHNKYASHDKYAWAALGRGLMWAGSKILPKAGQAFNWTAKKAVLPKGVKTWGEGFAKHKMTMAMNAATQGFIGKEVYDNLQEGDTTKALVSATAFPFAKALNALGLVKGIAGWGLLSGSQMGANSLIDNSRAKQFKEDSRVKFLKDYYSGLSSSQWGDIAPEKTMQWDEDSQQWYVPPTAKRDYWKNR